MQDRSISEAGASPYSPYGGVIAADT